MINSIFRAALAALQRPVAALLPFFAVMHSLRVLALAGEVLLTTGGHRAVITSRELGNPPIAYSSASPRLHYQGYTIRLCCHQLQLGFRLQQSPRACAPRM